MFTFNHSNHDLNIDLMVEMSQGEGKTKAYVSDTFSTFEPLLTDALP